MTKISIAIVSMFVTLFLAACSTTHKETMGEDFGNAVRTNTALQVINPDAGQEDQPPMALDGQKAEKVLEQYRKETGEAEKETLIQGISNQ